MIKNDVVQLALVASLEKQNYFSGYLLFLGNINESFPVVTHVAYGSV